MTRLPLLGLPAVAVVLVTGVLGVQVAGGGGRFEPLHPADPCAARTVTSRADGIDGLTERLVLLGIDAAACRLHLTRESLTLDLADPAARTDAEIAALHDGLRSAVRRMKADGSLPRAADLVEESLDGINLNPLAKAAIRALPDAVVNAALKTDDVLLRTIDDLDLRELLANLDDPDDLEGQIARAVAPAVRDSLVDRLRHLL